MSKVIVGFDFSKGSAYAVDLAIDVANKFQQAQQDNAQAFQKLQQEKLAPIQQKVFKAIENVGKAGNYVYIMQLGTALYTSSTLSKDVTADVKAEIQKLK